MSLRIPSRAPVFTKDKGKITANRITVLPPPNSSSHGSSRGLPQYTFTRKGEKWFFQATMPDTNKAITPVITPAHTIIVFPSLVPYPIY
jgi:hypothetical protein